MRQVNTSNEEKCSLGSVVPQCAKGGPPWAKLFLPYRNRGLQHILRVLPVLFFLVRGRQSAFSPHRGYSLHCDTILVQNMSSSNEQLSRPERDRHWMTINQTQKIIYDRTLDRMHSLSLSLSLSLYLHFNGHFPGGPWLASTGTRILPGFYWS